MAPFGIVLFAHLSFLFEVGWIFINIWKEGILLGKAHIYNI